MLIHSKSMNCYTKNVGTYKAEFLQAECLKLTFLSLKSFFAKGLILQRLLVLKEHSFTKTKIFQVSVLKKPT